MSRCVTGSTFREWNFDCTICTTAWTVFNTCLRNTNLFFAEIIIVLCWIMIQIKFRHRKITHYVVICTLITLKSIEPVICHTGITLKASFFSSICHRAASLACISSLKLTRLAINYFFTASRIIIYLICFYTLLAFCDLVSIWIFRKIAIQTILITLKLSTQLTFLIINVQNITIIRIANLTTRSLCVPVKPTCRTSF